MNYKLSTGVVVQVEGGGEEVTLRLIDTDHTAEWIVSNAEARALMAGVGEVLDA